MLTKELTMNCKQGFHIRPAQVLMEAVTGFDSSVTIRKADDTEADAKSMLGLMSLGLTHGEKVTVTVDGSDEEKAMATVEKLFANNFGE